MANTIKANINQLKKDIIALRRQIDNLKEYEDVPMQEASDKKRERLETEVDKKLAIIDELYISLLSFINYKMMRERKIAETLEEGQDYTSRLERPTTPKNIGDYYVRHPYYGKISLEELAPGELSRLGVEKERKRAGAREIDVSLKNDGVRNRDKKAVQLTKKVLKIQRKYDDRGEGEEEEK